MMNSKRIEDIERAAWYARLAFGHYEQTPKQPIPKPKKTKVIFEVMP